MPDDEYRVKLLREAYALSTKMFDIELQRLGWIFSKSQIAFAVLGVGLSVILSRPDGIAPLIEPNLASPRCWWVTAPFLAGFVLLLIAFCIVAFTIPPWWGKRRSIPDPLALRDSLYRENETVLLETLIGRYDESVRLNRCVTDSKNRCLYAAFSLAVFGFVLLAVAAVGDALVPRPLPSPRTPPPAASEVQPPPREGRQPSMSEQDSPQTEPAPSEPQPQSEPPPAPEPQVRPVPLAPLNEGARPPADNNRIAPDASEQRENS